MIRLIQNGLLSVHSVRLFILLGLTALIPFTIQAQVISDPLLTPDDPERDVAPDRITEDPEDVDLLVALRLTALRIASLFRSKDPLLLDERRVRTPKSVCLP